MKIKFLLTFMLLVVAISLFPQESAAQTTCEEMRAINLKIATDYCGVSSCNGAWCIQYHGLSFERFVNAYSSGYGMICNYTITDNGVVNNYSVGSGPLDDCPGAPPPPPPPGGPPGGPPPPPCPGCCQGLSAGPGGPTQKNGSIVNVESQGLGEIVPIVGSSFSLNYYSGFQNGRVADNKINFALSGSAPRDHITSFNLTLKRGSTVVDTASISNSSANLSYVYTWNGLDLAGVSPVDSAKFTLIVNEVSPTGTLPVTYELLLGRWNVKLLGLGGWLPSNLKHYDGVAKRLYSADGTYRNLEARIYGTSQLFAASEDGQEVYIFDSNGNHLYTKSGLLGANKHTFTYDTSGRLTTIVEPFSKTTTFNRNSSGVLTSITAASGQSTSIAHDSNGYLSSVTNPNSEVYSFTYYGTGGLLYTFTKPNSEVSTFEYSSDGLLTKDSHSGGYFFTLVKSLNTGFDFDISVTTSSGYSEAYKVNEAPTGASSHTTSLSSGATKTSSLTVYGSSHTKDESGGGYSSSVYSNSHQRFGDTAREITGTTIYAQGGNSRYTNITNSVLLSDPNDPFSITSMSRVDQLSGANTKLTTTFDPVTKKFNTSTYLGKTSELEVDSYERPVSIKIGSNTATVFGYTNEKLTSITQGSRVTTLSYNSLGLLQTNTNPLSQTVGYTYDSANRVASKILPDSRVVSYLYDGIGNLTGVTPPSRPIHGFSVNGHGLIGAYQPPTLTGVSSVNTTYSYNLDRQITAVARPDGGYLSYTYDPTTGVLQSITTPDGIYSYSMDTVTSFPSLIVTPANISLSINYVGRDFGSFYTYVNGSYAYGYAKTYGSYNLVANDYVTYGGGSYNSQIDYTYNDDEDLASAADLVFSYNTPNGQLTGTEIGSGTAKVVDSYTYNTFGEVTGYSASYAGIQIYNLTLGRDGAGRVSSKTQSMNSISNAFDYTFDVAGRLTQVLKNSVVVANYGYDSNSNRTTGNVGSQTTTASYDNQDRLNSYNTLTFSYNANGDLISKTNTTTSTTTSYAYDVFGNLTQVVLPGSGDVIEYEIDGLNRRIGKKLNGALLKRWVYMDRLRIAAELDSSGNILKRFVYGSKGNVPDYMIEGGENYRIISDNLGSPRLVVKVSDGTVIQRMDHDEFGRVTEDTNPGYLPFGFAGGLYDNQTSLVRFGARDYDSEVGRWTSKDPIGFNGGDTNLFGYVANDPINLIDPEGKTPYLMMCVPAAHGECIRQKAEARANKCGGAEPGVLEQIGNAASDSLSCLAQAANHCAQQMYNPNITPLPGGT